MAIHTVDHPVM